VPKGRSSKAETMGTQKKKEVRQKGRKSSLEKEEKAGMLYQTASKIETFGGTHQAFRRGGKPDVGIRRRGGGKGNQERGEEGGSSETS